MRIVWSLLAVERVEEIARYISQDKPGAANEWVTGIFDRVEEIKKFPGLGRKVPESDREDLREVFYGDYRIIYRTAPRRISVLTVRHGRQLLSPEDLEDD